MIYSATKNGGKQSAATSGTDPGPHGKGVFARGLRKAFGRESAALGGVDLEAHHNEWLVMLGPSGCGKSTALRCVAGLEQPDAGEVWLDGTKVYSASDGVNLPPDRRNIGMVFQSYAVWPHMSVAANIAFPLKVRREPRASVREKVDRALDLVGLDGKGHRFPSELSGGEQQRVALARALIATPAAILFDEPLSNLDATLRVKMRNELLRIRERRQSTAIYVTHDQLEAMALADRLVVIRGGLVEQAGPPQQVYELPRTRFVAAFTGSSNFLPAQVSGVSGDRVIVECAIGRVVARSAYRDWHPGDPGVICARPSAFALVPAQPEANSAARPADGVRITASAFLGEQWAYEVAVGDLGLKVHHGQADGPVTGADVRLVLRDGVLPCLLKPEGEDVADGEFG